MLLSVLLISHDCHLTLIAAWQCRSIYYLHTDNKGIKVTTENILKVETLLPKFFFPFLLILLKQTWSFLQVSHSWTAPHSNKKCKNLAVSNNGNYLFCLMLTRRQICQCNPLPDLKKKKNSFKETHLKSKWMDTNICYSQNREDQIKTTFQLLSKT